MADGPNERQSDSSESSESELASTPGKPAPKKPRAPRKPRASEQIAVAGVVEQSKPAQKPRSPRKKQVAPLLQASQAVPDLPAPTAAHVPTPDEVAAVEANVRRLNDALQAARADADEFQLRQDNLLSRLIDLDGRGRDLQESLTPLGRSLTDLENRASELRDLSPLRQSLDGMASEVDRLDRRAQEVIRALDEHHQSFQRCQERWTTFDAERSKVEPALDAAIHTVAQAEQRMQTAKKIAEEATRKLEELAREKVELDQSFSSLRNERHALAVEVASLHDERRRTIESFRSEMKEILAHAMEEIRSSDGREKSEPSPAVSTASVDATRDEAVPTESLQKVHADDSSLPLVQALPEGALAENARDELLRYLNDARTVAQELATLLQEQLLATHDAWSRVELERAVTDADRRRMALEERIIALGGEPSGGRGLLSHVATYIWDVLQKPADADKDPIEDLLKGLCAVELEIGVYVALNALARAMGDEETARLAAAHHAEIQETAGRLRAQITVPAIESAMRPVGV